LAHILREDHPELAHTALSEADADEIVRAFDAVVGACHSFPGPVWEVGSRLTAAAMKRMTTRGASESAELAGAYE
jgi:hypothetical protein